MIRDCLIIRNIKEERDLMKARKGGVKLAVIIVVAAMAVLGSAFFALLKWGQTTGSELQQSFFDAVYGDPNFVSGDPNNVTALLSPSFREQVDEPVLAQWMAAVKTGLGKPNECRKHDFVKTSLIRDGVMYRRTDGNVSFAKGSARSELEYRDWRITDFHVTSASIPQDWRHEVPLGQTPFYRERGKTFLTRLLSDQADDAFLMMSEGLQKETPMPKLKDIMKGDSNQVGKLKSVDFRSEEAVGPNAMRLLYRVQGEKAPMFASVKLQSEGMRCPVVAFQMNEEAPASQPTSAPTSRPTATSTSGPVEKPATQPAEKPAGRP